jgi:Domain of unknown function (DUF6265)
MVLVAGAWPTVGGAASRQRLSGTAQDSLTGLGWMAGCWQQRTGTRVTDEQWMRPAGGAMIGMSRTVSGDRLRAWEALRIVLEKGRVVYVAQPGGGPPTSFAASHIADTLVIFENPAHDFPQRIAYRRVGADSLVASISATRDGNVQRMDIPMRRMACAS